jgi:pantoate--beta-alanine ligase
MIEDLAFPVRLVVAPISRETDGLARSSRNLYLSEEERRLAAAFPRALFEAAERIVAGGAPAVVEGDLRERLGNSGFGIDNDELVDAVSMKHLSESTPRTRIR